MIEPFKPANARMRALRAWYPDTPRIWLKAIQRVRPSYPLIHGSRPDRSIVTPFRLPCSGRAS